MAVISTEFNRGVRLSSSSSKSSRIKIQIRGLCDALEGNVNDRSLIAELELSKKYEVVEGSPCDGGHRYPIEGEPNID